MMSEYGGALVGTVASDSIGDSISATLKPRVPGGCGFSLTLMRSDVKRLDGQYAATDCTVAENGPNLTFQRIGISASNARIPSSVLAIRLRAKS